MAAVVAGGRGFEKDLTRIAGDDVLGRKLHDAARTRPSPKRSPREGSPARRFDREGTGGRRHFASALTMLERRDGDDGASYLELAAFVSRQCAHPTRDLAQLHRRIVFSMCVSNVDDHLRNHGVLLGARGRSLAPAFELALR